MGNIKIKNLKWLWNQLGKKSTSTPREAHTEVSGWAPSAMARERQLGPTVPITRETGSLTSAMVTEKCGTRTVAATKVSGKMVRATVSDTMKWLRDISTRESSRTTR